MKITYIICLVTLMFISCAKEKNEETKYLSEQVDILYKKLSKCYERIIILPGSGCSGCITVAEDFFMENHDNSKYLFILTNINSLKILKHKTGVDVHKQDNVIIDKENKFSNYEPAIYPVIIFVNCITKKIDEFNFQRPGSDAFNKI